MERAPDEVGAATDAAHPDVTTAFLRRKHPDGKPFAIVVKTPEGVRHKFFTNPSEASKFAQAQSARGFEVWDSAASFKDPEAGRRASNVDLVYTIGADFDVGPGKPNASRRAALEGLTTFCRTNGFPLPDIGVNSGNGLHVHWVVKDGLPVEEWKPYVEAFKARCLANGVNLDPSVTGDAARVFRIPGTMNYKDPRDPKPVCVVFDRGTFSGGQVIERIRTSGPAGHGFHSNSVVGGGGDGDQNRTLVTSGHGSYSHTSVNRDLTHREPRYAETPENIARLKSQLLVLSADCPYEDWWRILVSIKSRGWECGGGIGRDWSKTAPDRYDDSAFDKLWSSARAEGGIGPGTVEFMAIQAGWVPPTESHDAEDRAAGEEGSPRKGRQSQTAALVAHVESSYELFHDNSRRAYAMDRSTREVRRIGSRDFNEKISASYYTETKSAVRSQSMTEAMATLAGLALHRGEMHAVSVRVAKHDGIYYIDLAQQGNSLVVRIEPGRWSLVECPPEVRFDRPSGMQPLPVPERGGTTDPIWTAANVHPDDRIGVIAWIVEAYRADTPYPALEVTGEQGSAKSTTQSTLRDHVDPNVCNLRSAPRNSDDVVVSAGKNHVVSYENASGFAGEVQDTFCVVATGGGAAKRTLYSDADETVLQVHNPIILNGIGHLVTRQDLVDRSISIELPTITDRKESAPLRAELEENRPRTFGALLTVFADALEVLPTITIPAERRPRMVEFARLGEAIAQGQGRPPGYFLDWYQTNRRGAIGRTIDASPVAAAVLNFIDKQPEGACDSAKNLFALMERHRPDRCDGWPRSAKGFADALRRAAPALRMMGVECRSEGRRGGTVRWSVKRSAEYPSCPEVLKSCPMGGAD